MSVKWCYMPPLLTASPSAPPHCGKFSLLAEVWSVIVAKTPSHSPIIVFFHGGETIDLISSKALSLYLLTEIRPDNCTFNIWVWQSLIFLYKTQDITYFSLRSRLFFYEGSVTLNWWEKGEEETTRGVYELELHVMREPGCGEHEEHTAQLKTMVVQTNTHCLCRSILGSEPSPPHSFLLSSENLHCFIYLSACKDI